MPVRRHGGSINYGHPRVHQYATVVWRQDNMTCFDIATDMSLHVASVSQMGSRSEIAS